METLSGVLDAFASFDAGLWAILLLGVVAGLLVGVLPGLTFVMGVLLLLPLTYGMEADSAVALMLAVYVAGTYGGAITSILLHVPGEPNHVPLLWDGHTMARQGRAAEALGWAAVVGAGRRAGVVGGARLRLRADLAARPQPRPARVLPRGPDRPHQRARPDRRLGPPLADGAGGRHAHRHRRRGRRLRLGAVQLRQRPAPRRHRLPADHDRRLRHDPRAGAVRRPLRGGGRGPAHQGAHRRARTPRHLAPPGQPDPRRDAGLADRHRARRRRDRRVLPRLRRRAAVQPGPGHARAREPGRRHRPAGRVHRHGRRRLRADARARHPRQRRHRGHPRRPAAPRRAARARRSSRPSPSSSTRSSRRCSSACC